MLFFQAVLLAGYVYAHVHTRGCAPRRAGAAALALLVDRRWSCCRSACRTPGRRRRGNPVAVAARADGDHDRAAVLRAGVNGPLLQRWLAATGHRARARPVLPLPRASNGGSCSGCSRTRWSSSRCSALDGAGRAVDGGYVRARAAHGWLRGRAVACGARGGRAADPRAPAAPSRSTGARALAGSRSRSCRRADARRDDVPHARHRARCRCCGCCRWPRTCSRSWSRSRRGPRRRGCTAGRRG